MNYPILMADIVNSGQKDSKKLMTQFKTIIQSINEKRNKNLLSPLTITLGDEFQGIIDNVQNGIEIIFEIEELIIQNQFDFKLRYVLNFGEIETEINNKIAYEMLGEGLTTAREKLNSLKNDKSRFEILLPKNLLGDIINNSFIIYQSIIDSWQLKDYNIVFEFLIHDDYKIVANNVSLNISSAWRRRNSLKIYEYKTIKKIILDLSKIKNGN